MKKKDKNMKGTEKTHSKVLIKLQALISIVEQTQEKVLK